MNTFQTTHDNVTVHVSISPCSWMYPNYGLQIQLSLAPNACNAASRFANDKTLNAYNTKGQALVEMAQACAARWLAEHGTQPLRQAEADWAEALAGFEIENARSEEKRKKKEAASIAKRKAEGYTHRFIAVIHPKSGDDYMIEAFVQGAPTDVQITKLLAKSVVKNDYRVDVL